MTKDRTGTRAERAVAPRKGQDIAERLVHIVHGIVRILPALETSGASKHVSLQLFRAASGGGSNYEEARGAESRADFIHKVRIATKELREAHYWLRVVQRSDWVEKGAVDGLVDEVDQLIAILVVSAHTARFGKT